MKMRGLPRALMLAAAGVALAGALALAETVYVRVSNTRVVDKPDLYEGKLVKRLYYRDRLDRTEKGGKWDKVTVDGTVGYVRSDDLDTSKPADNRNLPLSGGQSTSDPTFIAGTRALGPLGKKYTSEQNLEAGRKVVEEAMDKMAPQPDKLDAFQREGRVGAFSGEAVRK